MEEIWCPPRSGQAEPAFGFRHGNGAFLVLSTLGFAQLQQVFGIGKAFLQGDELLIRKHGDLLLAAIHQELRRFRAVNLYFQQCLRLGASIVVET